MNSRNNQNQNKGGRPRLAAYQKRTKMVRTMFSGNDYVYVKYKAARAGLSVSEYCHQAAMGAAIRESVSPELMDSIRKLAGIANNVNQIAHQMHVYGFEAVKDQCLRIVAFISNIINQIKLPSHDS